MYGVFSCPANTNRCFPSNRPYAPAKNLNRHGLCLVYPASGSRRYGSGMNNDKAIRSNEGGRLFLFSLIFFCPAWLASLPGFLFPIRPANATLGGVGVDAELAAFVTFSTNLH